MQSVVNMMELWMMFWVFLLSVSGYNKWKWQHSLLLLTSRNYRHSTYSSAASAWVRPSHRALSLSARLPPSHPAICYMGRSALSLWMDSTPPPAKKTFIQLERTHSELHMCACSLYLVAVPPSTDSFVVVSNGDSAEGTEERSDLNVKDVCQAPLKLSSCQKHLDQTHQGTDIARIDLNTCILLEKSTLGNKLCIVLNHGWTNTEKQIQTHQEKKMHQNLPHCLLD